VLVAQQLSVCLLACVYRWVHLVCALYIPGVAFSNVDKLNGVTLFEMPYTKWGAKVQCVSHVSSPVWSHFLAECHRWQLYHGSYFVLLAVWSCT